MDQKICLITGASKINGLGLNSALELGKLGYFVLPTARKDEDLKLIQETLSKAGIEGRAVKLDLTSLESIKKVTQTIQADFGKLDVLINNAAINFDGAGGENAKMPSDTPLEWYRESFETNVLSVISLTQNLLPLLKKSGAPRIVNLSSCLASLTMHSDKEGWMYNFKLPSYDMSKTALNSFTVELAWELRDTPFKINSAHPGWVKTDMGGSDAPMEIADGIKTTVALATLGADGPSGSFMHLGDVLPW